MLLPLNETGCRRCSRGRRASESCAHAPVLRVPVAVHVERGSGGLVHNVNFNIVCCTDRISLNIFETGCHVGGCNTIICIGSKSQFIPAICMLEKQNGACAMDALIQ